MFEYVSMYPGLCMDYVKFVLEAPGANTFTAAAAAALARQTARASPATVLTLQDKRVVYSMLEFRFIFQWSLFLRVQLTLNQDLPR